MACIPNNSFLVGAVASPPWFDSYHSYADHLTFLDDLVAHFPKNARIVSAGPSFEGRDIKGIHIFGSSGPGRKPAIIWHGTIHAREWIGSMVRVSTAFSGIDYLIFLQPPGHGIPRLQSADEWRFYRPGRYRQIRVLYIPCRKS
jgi:hypothetical protein